MYSTSSRRNAGPAIYCSFAMVTDLFLLLPRNTLAMRMLEPTDPTLFMVGAMSRERRALAALVGYLVDSAATALGADMERSIELGLWNSRDGSSS